MIKNIGSLTNDLLELAINKPSSQLRVHAEAILHTFCENMEAVVLIAIDKRQSLLIETSLNTIRLTTLETALDIPEAASVPIGCLHKCTEMVAKSGYDIMMASLSCTLLSQDAVKIADHMDPHNPNVSDFYKDLVRFLEYFASATPLPVEEHMTKSIISDGFGTMIMKFRQPPFCDNLLFLPILRNIREILVLHRDAKYALKDTDYRDKVLAFLDDLEDIVEGE